VNLAERRGKSVLVERIDVLRTAFRSVRARHHFRLEAVVILPHHLHCVWTLAPGDTDYSTRWSLMKRPSPVPSKKASAFRKAAPSGVNEVCGSAVFHDQADSTVRSIMSIGTR